MLVGYDTGKIDRSPGDFTHFVRLPNGSEGKLVKIDITKEYNTDSEEK